MPSYGGVGHRPRAVERYLLSGERCVVALRRHWMCIAEPWVTAVGSLLLVAWLTFDVADPRVGRPLDLLWWLWFALLGRAVWRTLDHRRTWFVATDRRLLMVYGFLVRRVAMMPLAKVTDMSYHRSPLGWVLGYGTFVLESAGQDQALHEIDHVPHPDPAYRAIVSEIFRKEVDEEVPSVDEDGEYRRAAVPGERSPHRAAADRAAAEGADTEGADADPTGRFALPEEQSRRWGERLRGVGERAGRGAGWLRGAGDGTPYPPAHPEPHAGTRHAAVHPRGPYGGRAPRDGDDDDATDDATGTLGDTDDADGGEWLYRSNRATPQDDGRDPPRDPTGYWG